jgi:hypothetical protein
MEGFDALDPNPIPGFGGQAGTSIRVWLVRVAQTPGREGWTTGNVSDMITSWLM